MDISPNPNRSVTTRFDATEPYHQRETDNETKSNKIKRNESKGEKNKDKDYLILKPEPKPTNRYLQAIYDFLWL